MIGFGLNRICFTDFSTVLFVPKIVIVENNLQAFFFVVVKNVSAVFVGMSEKHSNDKLYFPDKTEGLKIKGFTI